MASTLHRTRFPIDAVVCHGFWLLLCLLGVLGITSLSDGHFSYTVDDSYIHLAVAEEIAKGNYGVNPGEFSAPSSSVLWPFLLAPFVSFSWGQFVPLVLGVVSISLSIAIVLRRLRVLLPDTAGDKGGAAFARVLCTAAILMLANATWIVFTGLEHGLQLLATFATVDAILANLAGERQRPWHTLAICAGPLVRYENLSISGSAAFFFLLQGRWGRASALVGLPIVLLGGFSAFLLHHGYSAVPNSVLVKSGGGSLLTNFAGKIENNLMDGRGVLLAVFLTPLLGVAWIRRPWDKVGMAALSLALGGLLHLLVRGGDFQHRYDPYILSGLFFGGLGILFGLAPRWNPAMLSRLAAILGLFAFAATFQYLRYTLRIPIAGNNIYEQQYQMHRFVTEFWKQPVAVNDLGWVSYANENHVLDLWGLASKEALVARKNRKGTDWMAELTREKGAGLAMIYTGWFGGVPPAWERVGTLNLSRIAVTPALGWVDFYATEPTFASDIREKLRQFSATVPPDVVLEIFEKKRD